MNYPQQSAQGLASLGRYGDTMLVHMNPKEVAGLQQLAMSKGGSLTINPDTGMPEAFDLGAVFDFAAPILGGYFGLSPWLTAGIMGGKSLIEGDSPIEAAMSAFGGYSGGKMGATLKDFTAPLKVPTAVTNTFDDTVANINKMDTSKLMQADGGIKPAAFTDTTPFNRLEAPNFNVNRAGFNVPASGVQDKLNLNIPSNLKDTTVPPSMGIKDIGYNTSTSTPGVNMPDMIQPAEPTFAGGLGRVAQDPVGFAREVGEGDALMGAGKIGMYAAAPFAESILQPPEFNMDRSEDEKYDPNRRLYLNNDTGLRLLPNLNQPMRAAQGGAIKSYAMGGNVGNPSVGGGLSDLYNRPEGQTLQNISNDGYGLGRLSNLGNEQARYQAQILGYADGGDISNYKQDQAALNLNELPTLNVKTGSANYMTPDESGMYAGRFMKDAYRQNPDNPLFRLFSQLPNDAVFTRQMAKGGYLNGDGDGMSDSIPATIEGKQPARLADGEFVVPADVVSHLGNGSSKAGSKRLYAMLDKVRHARTGNKKQGKQINPAKYMPA
jgi:hypothetical protein